MDGKHLDLFQNGVKEKNHIDIVRTVSFLFS
jgi:hypothetical protein